MLPIPGTANVEHLEDNAAAGEIAAHSVPELERRRVHRLAASTAARPSCRSLTKYSGTSSDGKCPPVSGDLHRTICRYRSCAQVRGHFSMSRGYTLSADGTSTRSSGSSELWLS